MALEIRGERLRSAPTLETGPREKLATSDARAVERLRAVERSEPAVAKLAPDTASTLPALRPPVERVPLAVGAIVDARLGTGGEQELREAADAITRAQADDGSWRNESDGDTSLDASIMNHLAAVSLLRTRAMTPMLRARLESTLAASWFHLTGAFRAPEKMMSPLPRHTLRFSDASTGAMHQAVFGGERDSLYHALRMLNHSPTQGEVRAFVTTLAMWAQKVGSNYDHLNRLQALVSDVLKDATQPSTQFAAGLLVSYGVTALIDRLCRDKIHNATPAMRAQWDDLGKIGEMLKSAYLRHAGESLGKPSRLNNVLQFLTPATPLYAAAVVGAHAAGAHPLTYVGLALPPLLMREKAPRSPAPKEP